jgi:xylulokinase
VITPDVLTIDVGTSALKAVLYDSAGQVAGAAVERYTYQIPQPDRAETDPETWWAALVTALAQLRAKGFELREVQVIGLTGQMHTAVLLDEAGQPLTPTILWLDRRAVAETAELQAHLKLPPQHLNSTYTLPKLLWLARHRPEVLGRTRTLLWPKDYLRYRLTGLVMTDLTEAGGAALLDWDNHTWATDRLALVKLDPAVLPPLRPADDAAGPLLPQVAADLGLSSTATVVVGAGDSIALMGAAPPRAGRLTCSLGSSAMISCLLEPEQTIEDRENRLYIYPLLPYRLLNGVLSSSGASLTWVWRALYDEGTPLQTLLAEMQETSPGADGLFYLPFLTGERNPFWNDALRGAFYGLTLAHHRSHLVRAVLEGVAFSVRHLLDIGEELGLMIGEIAMSGGGAATPGWPQIIADVCQRPVLIYAGQETVTRPLYAYCVQVIDASISFEQALDQTFDEPRYTAPRSQFGSVYNLNYDRYRKLSEFASSQLS